jgi:hypothetical protein
MRREPLEYGISGRILRIGPHEYSITIIASAADHIGPGSTFTETGKGASREEATRKQHEMIRDLAKRLTAQGNKVVIVDSDL